LVIPQKNPDESYSMSFSQPYVDFNHVWEDGLYRVVVEFMEAGMVVDTVKGDFNFFTSDPVRPLDVINADTTTTTTDTTTNADTTTNTDATNGWTLYTDTTTTTSDGTSDGQQTAVVVPPIIATGKY